MLPCLSLPPVENKIHIPIKPVPVLIQTYCQSGKNGRMSVMTAVMSGFIMAARTYRIHVCPECNGIIRRSIIRLTMHNECIILQFFYFPGCILSDIILIVSEVNFSQNDFSGILCNSCLRLIMLSQSISSPAFYS